MAIRNDNVFLIAIVFGYLDIKCFSLQLSFQVDAALLVKYVAAVTREVKLNVGTCG